jgi:hypothetical protein
MWFGVAKYYTFNGQRIAMQRCADNDCREPVYLHGDHLGSVSLATDADGELIAQARHEPYSKMRWDGNTVMPTDYAFTGQRQESSIGIYYYGARYMFGIGEVHISGFYISGRRARVG